MIGFIIGLLIGGCAGVIIMAIMSIARESAEEADRIDDSAHCVPDDIVMLYDPELRHLRRIKESEQGEPYNWKSPETLEVEDAGSEDRSSTE